MAISSQPCAREFESSISTTKYNLELIDLTTSFITRIVENVNQDVARLGYPSLLYYIIPPVLLSIVDWNVRYHVAGHCLPNAKSRRPGIFIVHCVLLCVRIYQIHLCSRCLSYNEFFSYLIVVFKTTVVIPFPLHTSYLIRT